MRLAGVLGWPVAHSRSPAIHNAAYRALGIDAAYAALAVAPGELAAALAGVRAMGFLGVNVTVPHKEEARRLCDEVEPLAERVGAVNTVVVREGRLVGANTDVGGFARALADAGGARGPVVVLGAGGSARAVVAAVAAASGSASASPAAAGVGGPVPYGSDTLRIVARRPERAAGLGGTIYPWTPAGLARALDGAGLLIDTTPIALSPTAEDALPSPVPLDLLADGALVASLVYHREAALLTRARARGLRVMDGAAMLIYQAALAFTLMTGRDAPLDVMRAAFYAPTAR
jgi:shikimate dehydrogenase